MSEKWTRANPSGRSQNREQRAGNREQGTENFPVKEDRKLETIPAPS